MKGKDIIKAIVNEDGYDKEYELDQFFITVNQKSKPKKTYKNIDELLTFDIDSENNEVTMYVEDPIAARKFGLSDRYHMYIWDGKSMYFFEDPNAPANWSISYGGGSTTLVAESVTKFRDLAAKKMIEATAKNAKLNGSIMPEWMNWRVRHFEQNKSGLNIFE